MYEPLYVHDVLAPDCAVISLCGELDIATAPIVLKRIAELAELGRSRLVFDFAPLEFVDGYGLRVLFSVAKGARDRGGWVRLISVPPRTRRILYILRLTKLLPMYRTLDDALRDELLVPGRINGFH